MANRNFKRVISALVALVMVLSIMPSAVFAKAPGNDGSAEMNEAYANRESLMPIGPSFNVDTLLEWTPESDPDAAYSRASIKLADRVGGFVVNPVANPEAKLMLCSLANSDHDHTSAQGTENFLSWAFNYWQYTDSFVYWSGSQEGLVVVPTGEFTDAAHTNGVPVVATLGFPWGSGAGDVEQVQQFVQKASDGSFPVADKMIQVMDYYGFDGYFFNQESYGCGPEEGRLIEEMMRYMHKKRPDMLISWYDSMLPEGGVSYQNAVTDRNKQFMSVDEEGIVPIDEFMMNYNWGQWQVDTTVTSMESVGRSPYDAFAGLDVQQNCMNTWFDYSKLLDADGLLRLSIAMYCPNSTLGLSPDGEAFHKTEQKFYTNNDGDPRLENPSGAWAGMSRFFADKTPVTSAPFVTNFNAGHGKGYYVDGALSREKEWSYQSIQDVMPTWTWIIDSTGADSNLKGAYDFDTVYNGGSSIAFEGSLTDANGKHNIMLYSTSLPVKSGMSLELTSLLTGGAPSVDVVLYLDDGSAVDYESCEKALLAVSAAQDSWNSNSWPLDAYVGKTIKAIGFEIAANGTAVDSFKLNLGRLAVLDKARRDTSAAKNFRLEDILYKDAFKAEARIAWDTVTGASGYLISQIMADGSEQVLMETPNNYFYLPALVREAGQENVTLKVAGINRNGQISSKSATLVIPWKYQDGDTDDNTPVVFTNLCLNAPVIDVSFENSGEPASKALDGTSENNSKWCATNWSTGYMVIDLGEPKTVNRWRVEHAEYGGESHDMNTVDFNLQYFDEASQSFKVAHEFWGNTQAVTDVLLDEPVTAQKWKLEVFDDGYSPWGGIRIYEWQMFSERALPAPQNIPMQNVSCINNPGAEDSFIVKNAPVGTTVRVYSGDTVLGEGVTIAADETKPEQGSLNLTIDLGTTEAGKVQYVVVDENKAESPRLCAEFFAEGLASAIAEDVAFELYKLPGSNTSYSHDGTEAFTSLTVNGLAQGDIVRVYENGAESAATKQSAPVAAGATSATVIGVPVATAGDTVLISVQRVGQAESEKYEVASPAFPGATATVQVFAVNEQGESLTGVQFELVKDGQVAGQVGTTSDSGGKIEVPFGTYTIRCVGVPAGYVVPEIEIQKIVQIEGWVYPITVQVMAGSVDPEPTDPEPTDPVVPEYDTFMRIFHLDAGRKYFSPENICKLIDVMASSEPQYNYLELYLSDNQGFRFALDDMTVTTEHGTYDLTPALGDGYVDGKKTPDGSNKYLTQAEMTEIIAYAASKGIGVIPCVNVPGHMGAILEQFPQMRYTGSKSSINLENAEAVAFAKAITEKYAAYFQSQGCKFYNFGADEYANDVGNMGLHNIYLNGVYAAEFVPFTNDIAGIVKAHGMTPMCFNDGVCYNNDTSSKLDTDTLVCYWTSGWWGYNMAKPATLTAAGYKLINTNGDYYWIVGDNKCSAEKAAGFDPHGFIGDNTVEEPAGAMFCVWSDVGDADGQDDGAKVVEEVSPVLTSFAGTLPAPVNPNPDPEPTDPVDPDVEALVAAAQAAAKAAEDAQRAAEEAAQKAEEAEAAAEAAAASAAEDKSAAEAAQAKAEEARAQAEAAQLAAQAAQSAAEDAAVAADESNKAAALEAQKAAEEAAKAAQDAAAAAESARKAAAAQEAAQAAQAAAEEAQAVAEQAQKDAEAAKAAAEEAAKSSADDKEAAEKAAQEAAAAQKAAEDAQKAAEDAKAAAETAKNEAAASNEAAAKSAEQAAQAAKEAAEYYRMISEMKSQMAEYLEDAQKAKEEAEAAQKAAEAAELACAKYYALYTLSEYVDEDDYRETELKLVKAAMDDGIATINAAETPAAVEEALAAAKAVIDTIPTAEEMKMPFTDVKEGDWFEYAVHYVYQNDLFNGVSATEFGPRHSMTRAQMITVLYRLAGQPAVEGTLSFKDVKADAYYAKAVLWGVENRIVKGTTDDTFSPNEPLTRAQAAAMLYRYMGAEPVAEDHLAGFADVKDVPAYAVDALNWAVANGILNGAQDGENLVLAAGRQINRAEVASLLMRLEK